jgi:hypothetical protein
VDITDTYFVQNTYYRMSYCLGCTEDNVDVKNAVDEAQKYYNTPEKREWVEWAGKILMPWLHVQMAMEQVDATRVEQEEQRKRERVQKEAELEEREMEYIRQVDAKEIDEVQFRELVNELDMERAMAESVAEGPATTQDEEVGESEREESTEEEPAAPEKGVESSTVGKQKRKAAPTRAKVYTETGEPASNLLIHRQHALTQSLTVRPVLHAEDEADVHHHPTRAALQKCQTDKSRCTWRGKSREVVEGEVAITHKWSKGELATQGDELSSEDEVQEVGPPRGEFRTVIPRVAADKVQRNS